MTFMNQIKNKGKYLFCFYLSLLWILQIDKMCEQNSMKELSPSEPSNVNIIQVEEQYIASIPKLALYPLAVTTHHFQGKPLFLLLLLWNSFIWYEIYRSRITVDTTLSMGFLLSNITFMIFSQLLHAFAFFHSHCCIVCGYVSFFF